MYVPFKVNIEKYIVNNIHYTSIIKIYNYFKYNWQNNVQIGNKYRKKIFFDSK